MEKNTLYYILKQVSEGNESAFRIFFDLYYQRLFNVAFYFLKSKECAEEAVADVFFLIWKKRVSLLEIEDIKSYMFIMIKNESIRYIKKGKLFSENNQDLYIIESLAEDSDPERKFIEKEYLHLIQDAINSLPEKCKEVFRLSVNEKLKQKEIAILLDISIKTVEAHMANAYKRIGQYVNKKYMSCDKSIKIYSILF